MSDIIDEIDRLEREATPGPWSVFGVVCHIEVVCGWPNGDVVPILRMHKEGDWPSNGAPPANIAIANGEFVSKLRNNWPAIRERLRELQQSEADSETLRSKLTDILTRTVDAIKGPPEPGTLHSWHDLPEHAALLVANEKAMIESLREAERKARAFDAIVDGTVELAWGEMAGIPHWTAVCGDGRPPHLDQDLLTAIETAIAAGKETQ